MSFPSAKFIFLAMAAGAIFLGASPAMAQSKVSTYSAQVIVQNAFTIAETTPLNLGTIAAVSSNTAGTQAAISLNPGTGATTTAQGAGGSSARILAVAPPTRGMIAVTHAPPSTVLTVSNPGSSYDLTNAAVPGTPPLVFTPAYAAVGFNYVTSPTGTLNINIGGTLTTTQSPTAYADGVYMGSYQLQITY